jgi:hypothetical protein
MICSGIPVRPCGVAQYSTSLLVLSRAGVIFLQTYPTKSIKSQNMKQLAFIIDLLLIVLLLATA